MSMDAHHILVVDDDRRLRDLLKRYLTQNDFLVTAAENAAEAERFIQSMQFDLIVMDIMMPGQNGLEFTKTLREKRMNVPVLMLTAKDQSQDRIGGLEVGADDYLTKPFEPRELVLRIQSILRRTSVPADDDSIAKPIAVEFGDYRFDIARGELFRNRSEMINLTTSEVALLRVLAELSYTPCSREDLVARCDIIGGERAIDVQVTRLRRKIEIDPAMPRYLQTIRGRGYVLKPEQIFTQNHD